MRRPIFIALLLIAVIIGLSVFRSVMSNVLSTSGIEIDKIANEVEFYKTENLLLKEKLYQEESLTNVASRASELGFMKGRTQVIGPASSVLTRIFSEN